MKLTGKTEVRDYVPSFLMVGVIVCLILASFLKAPAEEGFWLTIYNLRNGLICVVLLIVGIVINLCRTKSTASTKLVFKEMDYQTLLLLASLFVVIEGISRAGVTAKLSELLIDLGGNITPIGASANITGIGILRKEGYEVKARDFMKISVPFTITAVLSGYLFIWIFWGLL